MIIALIGVCGCGKTTIGISLAKKLGSSFRDADEFHSEENKTKMSRGIALTDEDRMPWLLAIHYYIKDLQDKGMSGVVTCSALKKHYRDILKHGYPEPNSCQGAGTPVGGGVDVTFVLLHGRMEVLCQRMKERRGHFMPASLLDSQLEVLEMPSITENCIIVDVDNTVENITAEIIKQLTT